MTERIEYFAPCTLGLEGVLEQELRELDAPWVRAQRGGVHFSGPVALGYAANLWLRSAIRVQEKIFQGKVRSEQDLYALVRRLDWSRFMTLDHTLAVDASVRDSAMTHSKYVALKTKDAIVDQFRDRYGKRPNVDVTAPDLPLKVVLSRNVATIYRNLSGDSLHKRGWRPIQVKSPLAESTAGGLLLATDWDRDSALVDPMCGSGTFLIEAACIASGRAPGRLRMFAFETWPDFDEEVWERIRSKEREGIRDDLPYRFEGGDHHAGALSLARRAAESAGVAHLVTFQETDVRRFQPAAPVRLVVVNPPYGERIGTEADLKDSWEGLGNFLHQSCRGATAHVLCGNPELAKLLGLRTSRRFPVMNGPIDCRWLRYDLRDERAPRHRVESDEA